MLSVRDDMRAMQTHSDQRIETMQARMDAQSRHVQTSE